jgi:hypothetical protein
VDSGDKKCAGDRFPEIETQTADSVAILVAFGQILLMWSSAVRETLAKIKANLTVTV